MRTFKEFNNSYGEVCPVCGNGNSEETMLIPIQGTQSGNIAEAMQVHTKCLQDNISFMLPAGDNNGVIFVRTSYPHRHATTEEHKEH